MSRQEVLIEYLDTVFQNCSPNDQFVTKFFQIQKRDLCQNIDANKGGTKFYFEKIKDVSKLLWNTTDETQIYSTQCTLHFARRLLRSLKLRYVFTIWKKIERFPRAQTKGTIQKFDFKK